MEGVAAIITAIASLLTAIGICWNIYMTYMIKHATNGMKDALVEAVGKAEHAQGVLNGEAKAEGEKPLAGTHP